MKKLLIGALVGSAIVAGVAYWIAWNSLCNAQMPLTCAVMAKIPTFYAASLRGYLFTGFLTMGGFLLSLKTFIVVSMKKEVFDSNEYFERWRQRFSIDSRIGSLYQPLNELSTWLHYAILSCVLTSASQFTIGLFENLAASIFCMWAAAFSICLLLICLWRIRGNLHFMFEHLEATSAERAKKAAEVEAAKDAVGDGPGVPNKDA
jgi:hypothetical protein